MYEEHIYLRKETVPECVKNSKNKKKKKLLKDVNLTDKFQKPGFE